MSLQKTEDTSKRSQQPERAASLRMWQGGVPTSMMSPETVLRALPGAELTLNSSMGMVQQKGIFLAHNSKH